MSRGVAEALPTFPAEAAVALANSVQADELDDRCGAPSTHVAPACLQQHPCARSAPSPRGVRLTAGVGDGFVARER